MAEQSENILIIHKIGTTTVSVEGKNKSEVVELFSNFTASRTRLEIGIMCLVGGVFALFGGIIIGACLHGPR